MTPPCDFSKISRTWGGVIVHPALGRWQLTQRRPLPPRSWKNSPLRSIWPAVLNVAAEPDGFGNRRPFGSARNCASCVTPMRCSSAIRLVGNAEEIERTRPSAVALALMVAPLLARVRSADDFWLRRQDPRISQLRGSVSQPVPL